MPDHDEGAVEGVTDAAAPHASAQELSKSRLAVAERAAERARQTADSSRQMAQDLARMGAGFDREVIDAIMKQATQTKPSEPEPDEAEERALLDSFDGRITEIEQRIDRVLAIGRLQERSGQRRLDPPE